MKSALMVLAASVLLSFAASAQELAFQDGLLDRMMGAWVMRGTIEGKETTHDVTAEWVLNHGYVRLHEVSREKDAQGRPAYEAIVFIGWDRPLSQYACLWLDSTGGGGLKGDAIGHAPRGGDAIAFLFKGAGGSLFHTTFAYDKKAGTWRWLMDGETAGKLQPFARLTLTRT